MKKLPLKILIITTGIFLVITGVLLYCVHTINDLGNLYVNRHQLIAEQQAKEKAHFDTKQIISASAKERDTLAGFYLAEKDTIKFIGLIEGYAKSGGLTVETTELAVEPKTEKSEAVLKIGFKFSGTLTQVKHLIELFETLPYHKSIPSLSLTIGESGQWQGTITLRLTLKS